MSAASSLRLWWTLSLCLLVSVSAVPVNITAAPGQSVSLPCRAPSGTDIIVVQWTRPELEPDYVFVYRDGIPERENQHPSFEGRVELKDREMKDRDVSLLLKNVTRDDTGTYECRVVLEKTNIRKRAILKDEPISSIVHLQVQSGDEEGGDKEGGDEEGNSRTWIAVVGAVVAVVAAGALIGGGVWAYKHRSADQSSYKPLVDEESR